MTGTQNAILTSSKKVVIPIRGFPAYQEGLMGEPFLHRRRRSFGIPKKLVDASGKILIEEQEVPNRGSFSLFSDPDGRAFGILETKPGYWLTKQDYEIRRLEC